jgi:hypothetical protein
MRANALTLNRQLSNLNLRERILLELDMTNALSPGELFALWWKCFDAEERSMRVSETVYRGKIRPWGKVRKSLEIIPFCTADPAFGPFYNSCLS